MIGITTATIIVLLSGGSDLNHYLTGINKNVKKHVADKERRRMLLDESKDLSKELKSLIKDVNGHIEDLTHVHADFQALGTDFEAIKAKMVADQKKAAELILDAREVMRAQTTKEEWEAIFKPES